VANDFNRPTVYAPIKSFSQVPPEAIVDAFNSLIVDINAADASLGMSQSPFVTMKQLRLWAASNGSPSYIYTIDNAVSADIANVVNIQWNHGNTMVYSDALYVFIQSTLGFTSGQMVTALSAMQGYTP